MAKREKKVIYSGITSETMEGAFAEYAAADARLVKINAAMDEQFTRIREKYSEEILKLSETKDRAFEIVQAYAVENRETLFAKKKSVEAAHGIFGFRTGTPKLKTLKGFTWKAVLNLLKEFLPGYVRVIEEPAKDKLLADRDLPEVAINMEKCGIQVVQDEVFFIELKKEGEEAV